MIEFLILFFVLPTAIYLARFSVHAIPMLWVLMAYCLWVLEREGNLILARPDMAGLCRLLPSIFAIFLPFAAAITVLVYRFAPRDLFSFFRAQPRFWGLVMVAYPLLSVYPQGIIYRAFFFDRYRALFPNAWLMVLMSTMSLRLCTHDFSQLDRHRSHCRRRLALRHALRPTGSLFVSSFERALYGCWLFTVGLGRSFFYKAQWKQADLPQIP